MTDTPEEKREAAAIRRRWVTLGEVVAVLAVLISAATLWNSYEERKGAEAERTAAGAKETRAETALVLRARSADDGKRLTIEPVDGDQVIQSQRVIFPSTLGVQPVETAGDPRIEGRWIADALKKADTERSAAGDLRVPVAIVTRFTSKGGAKRRRAVSAELRPRGPFHRRQQHPPARPVAGRPRCRGQRPGRRRPAVARQTKLNGLYAPLTLLEAD